MWTPTRCYSRRSDAAVLPLHSSQARASSHTPPIPFRPICALFFSTLQCQRMGFYRPDWCLCSTPCFESASAGWKKVFTCIWHHRSSKIPALQVRVENMMYYASYCANPWADGWFLWWWAREEGEDKDFNCVFSRYSTIFGIQGLHLVHLLLGRLKPYYKLCWWNSCTYVYTIR